MFMIRIASRPIRKLSPSHTCTRVGVQVAAQIMAAITI